MSQTTNLKQLIQIFQNYSNKIIQNNEKIQSKDVMTKHVCIYMNKYVEI